MFLPSTLIFCIFLSFIFPLHSQSKQSRVSSMDFYTDTWDKIKTLEAEGKPKSALKYLEEIYLKASSENNSAMLIKAVIHKLLYSSNLEEDEFYSAFNKLREEIKTVTLPTRNILHSMLGEMYWKYYQRNRYKFLSRTKVENSNEKDVRKWDLETIVKYSSKNYLKSLEEPDKLKEISIKSIEPVLSYNNEGDSLRPTLYDFLLHRAIDFFSNQESGLVSPKDKFYISKDTISFNGKSAYELYHSDYETFIQCEISNIEVGSFHYKALNLFKELLKFRLDNYNSADKNKKESQKLALFQADLKRHTFIYNNSIDPNKKNLYLETLNTLKTKYTGSQITAEISFLIASEYMNTANLYNPAYRKSYEKDAKKAVDICNNAVQEYPDSFGGKNCKALIANAKEKSIRITIEKNILPDESFPIFVNYKNLQNLHISIFPFSEKDITGIKNIFEAEKKLKGYLPPEIALIKYFSNISPINSLKINLGDPGDFNAHSSDVILPPLKAGEYIIFASPSQELTYDKNGISFDTFNVSNIAYINRFNNKNLEFYLTNRKNGDPLENINISQVESIYDNKLQKYIDKPYKSFKTDSRGYFSVPQFDKTYMNYFFEVDYKGEKYHIGNPLQPMGDAIRGLFYQGVRTEAENYEYATTKTFFFTDRAIYRPGQRLFFKALPVSSFNKVNKIIPNENIVIQLLNVNREKVSELSLKSNEFGSVNGSFILPTNGLTGKYTLICSNFSGEKKISVEEYKRPKFKVEIQKPSRGLKLRETITISGTAKAYSGAPIDGAGLKYIVKRTAIFPRWDFHYGIYPPVSSEAIVATGESKTNEKGVYEFKFLAIPDESLDISTEPVFNYLIQCDVTDINGETVSDSIVVPISNVALRLNINIGDYVVQSQFNKVQINTKSITGEFLSSSGKLEISKLKEPAIPFRERVYERADRSLYTLDEWRKALPFDPYGGENEKEFYLEEEKVFSSDFNTSISNTVLLKDVEKWKTGIYRITAISNDIFNREVKDTRYFTLLNPESKKLSGPGSRLFSILKNNLEVGEKLQILISNTNRGKALFETEFNGKIIDAKWIDSNTDSEQTLLEIPITEKERGNFGIHYTYIYNNRLFTRTETILVPHSDKELKISFETFRNKLQPSEEESWKIKIEGLKKDKLLAEMVGTLYDASLESFKKHNFNFDIYSMYYASMNWESANGFRISSSYIFSDNWNEKVNYINRNYRELNWFGYNFSFNEPILYKRMSRGAIMESPMMDNVPNTPSPASKKSSVSKEESERSEDPPVQAPNIRSDFRETAFFLPDLKTDSNGNLVIAFKLPDSLTTWKFLGFAHTVNLEFGFVQNELVAQKLLMVTPNAGRFLREGDTMDFTIKLTNLSKESLWGKADLDFIDPISMKNVNNLFYGSTKKKKEEFETSFEVKAEGSNTVTWKISIPSGINSVMYRVNASSGKYSDGEESILPILTNRMMVTETLPISINKKGLFQFKFPKLLESELSSTIRHHKLTFEYTSNPVWLALSSLPYLAEYPYECNEQTFSRYYANSLSAHILKTNPEIEKVFKKWKQAPKNEQNALTSNLEKNQDLKSLLLEETPWVINGASETENKRRMALLFQSKKILEELNRALYKLKENQSIDGAFSWFKGMENNRYITQYIIGGFGHLKKIGIYSDKIDPTVSKITDSGVRYLDKKIREDYEFLKQQVKINGISLKDYHLNPLIIQYLYIRSFFPELKISSNNIEAYKYFYDQAMKYKFKENIYSRGMIALVLHRNGDTKNAKKILESLRENAIETKEMGTYWKSDWSYIWYEMPVETQSLLIECFYEIEGESEFLNNMKTWLLKNKQTNEWSSTKSTSEAIYSLLLGNSDIKKTVLPEVSIGEQILAVDSPALKAEAGTGYFKTSFSEREISPSMGKIKIESKSKNIAFGGLYWQYFENLDKITPASTPLKIKKKIFLQKVSDRGTVLLPLKSETLQLGDTLKVRIEITVDRDMEFVHLKDMRASALEPMNVLSTYKYRDGLGFYESTRDSSTNFFFDRLPKGVYVFEYPLRVSRKGNFSNGITTIQSMYAPEFSSHSEGIRIKVE